jgi:hypothetical protein
VWIARLGLAGVRKPAQNEGDELGKDHFISSESAIDIPVEMIHYGVTKTMQLPLARALAKTTAGRVPS